MSFLEELVKKKFIESADINEIKNLANEKYQGDLDLALIDRGIDEKDILEAKGEYYAMPIRAVDTKELSMSILNYIPEESASHYRFAPLSMKDGVLEVGVSDPGNSESMNALQFISAKLGVPFKIYLISNSDYQKVMNSYKGISLDFGDTLVDAEKQEEINVNKEAQGLNASEGVTNLNQELQDIKNINKKIVEDAPIIKIVAVILKNAIEGGASDVHIEHVGERVKVRYRVDGILHTSIMLPANSHSGIVARVKILSKMHLDEKRKPQDGSFSAVIDNRKVDFRVSTMPGYYGEKVAIRILDSQKGLKPIDDLGLSPENLALLKEAINKPFGLILITGPTGSGKSTTLYSIMNELDKEKSNIVTLEDPVEYHMKDVNQSQVLPEIGYTFASGLRSILRQDPDIIVVGEIRDKETAQLAIQAALTGHLVLSTLHTNNSIGVIPRLVDMGVDPYLIAPTLVLSIAQRLARMTCDSSRKEIPMEESVRKQFEEQFKDLPEEFRKNINIGDKMYDAVPSPECPSGTKDRIAIFEMFKIDKEMQQLILKSPNAVDIYNAVRRKGMLTMKEDAMLKAVQGVIPYTEVYNFNNENE